MLSLLFAIVTAAPSILPLLDDAFLAAPSIEGVAAAFASEGALKVLGTISIAQWVSIVGKAVTAVPAAKQFIAAIHPAFAEMISDINKGIERHDVAANINSWFKANQPKTISGYGADGSVTDIPNPDAK